MKFNDVLRRLDLAPTDDDLGQADVVIRAPNFHGATVDWSNISVYREGPHVVFDVQRLFRDPMMDRKP